MMSDLNKELAKKKAELEKVSNLRVAAIVSKVDTNEDGRINFEGISLYHTKT